jgi:NAD(P)-dependent dehydrogenase (short-subunit alcohol dehydrogenase family)
VTALDGSFAVVTGGGSGIGLAIAERFAREGARVVIVGRNRARLDAALARIGPRASATVADVADDAALARVFAPLERVDLLVTCAGGAMFGAIDEVNPDAWRALFAGRFFGQLGACHHAVAKMPNGGAILLCSGIAGRVGLAKYAGGAALCGAVNALGRALAVELAPRGIRVNVLSPGLIQDTAIESNLSPAELATFYARAIERIPAGRAGAPRDVADAAYFLATCAYATGQVIDVDGGWTAS